MALFDDVKNRIGVHYSDAKKDAEVKQMIEAAIAYFRGAGWNIGPIPKPLEIEGIVLYCKMAQSTDPAQLINHPVLLSFIAQGRA